MTLRMARTTKVQPLNFVAKAGIGDFGGFDGTGSSNFRKF